MFGFYRLAAAVPKLKVADAAFNTEELRRCFRQAAENGADAVVFPELCVTGYSCGDLFFQERLLAEAEAAAVDFAARTAGSRTVAVIGLPFRRGDALFNAAAVAAGGAIRGLVP